MYLRNIVVALGYFLLPSLAMAQGQADSEVPIEADADLISASESCRASGQCASCSIVEERLCAAGHLCIDGFCVENPVSDFATYESLDEVPELSPFVLPGEGSLSDLAGCETQRNGLLQELVWQLLAFSDRDEGIAVRACDGPRAAVARLARDGRAMLYYSPTRLRELRASGAPGWTVLFVLAHEIGHHINTHMTRLAIGFVPGDELLVRWELAADVTAVRLLRRMGARLEDILTAIRSLNYDAANAGHPGRQVRIDAARRAWRTSQSVQAAQVLAATRDAVLRSLSSNGG